MDRSAEEQRSALLEEVVRAVAGKALAVVEYGSGRNDLDLLVVLKDGTFQTRRTDVVDCLIAPEAEVRLRCSWRDLAFTEPIVTGTVVHGSDTALDRLRSSLFEGQVPSGLVSRYLQERARVEFAAADAIFAQCKAIAIIETIRSRDADVLCPMVGTLEVERIQSAYVDTLGYALCYVLAAEHYAESSEILRFSELRERVPEVEQVRRLHPGRQPGYSRSAAERMLHEVRRLVRPA